MNLSLMSLLTMRGRSLVLFSRTNSVKFFAGLVYCGNCNAPMFLSKAVKKNGRESVPFPDAPPEPDARTRRSSGKLEIQVESEDVPEQPMTPLKTAILQANQGIAQLTSGKAATMREIANKLKMDRSFLARTLKLANLAPDIVKLIWENRQPETLTLDNLRKGIPESWEEQRKSFLS